jgi:acyl-CoA synthetase (AMP-forming)/AMP-acid ligase II
MQRFAKLLEKIREQDRAEALIWKDQSLTFRDIEEKRLEWLGVLQARKVQAGQVVGLRADYTPEAIALFLALLSNRNIVALISPYASNERILHDDSQAEFVFKLEQEDWYWEKTGRTASHPLLTVLKESNSAGFIIFSSGSTGRPKAILHDLDKFLIKFATASKKMRTLTFLLFDHIAGIDTLFYTLWSGAVQILPQRREVKYICALVQRHRVEVLPTSPTFLNLLCLYQEYRNYDLSSLRIVTYGSERMSPGLLATLNDVLPGCRFIQKYGTSEVGSPRSRSKGNDSLWINLSSSECELRVVDNLLWVRSPSTMMGYLNAPSPFDESGWFCTGDEVLVDGEWIQILGRRSELIFVGGEKVYPAEIEDAIREVAGVVDVVASGEAHPLTGQIVCALVQVQELKASPREIVKNVRKHCRSTLDPYKVPVKIEITDKALASQRQKKLRVAKVGATL